MLGVAVALKVRLAGAAGLLANVIVEARESSLSPTSLMEDT